MQHPSYLFHPDVDLPSDGEDDDTDYMDSATTSGSSTRSPDSGSDWSMQSRTDLGSSKSDSRSRLGDDSGSLIYPHDSISNRPPQSVASESPSVVSLHDESTMFRTVGGRAFNSRNDLYMLPSDGAELSRHDVVHRLLQLNINSLYLPVALVQCALTPSPYWDKPALLDIGCGSGKWAIEMANEFPHAECTGLDLAPPSVKGPDKIPPNCRFEIDDANLSLAHYYNCFNMVHVRAVHPGIVDFDSFLYNVAQTLRPHGLLMIISGSFELHDQNFVPLPNVREGQPGFSALQRVWAAVYTAYRDRSTAIDAIEHWPGWLQANPNYHNVVTQDLYIPLGPWLPGLDERQIYVSELMRYNLIHVSDAYRPLLMAGGFEEHIIDEWLESCNQELQQLRVHAYVKWRYTWAERAPVELSERMEQPVLLDDYRILRDPRSL